MEKEFVPYEQALALKDLGFDEPCIGYYESTYGKDKVIIDNSGLITNTNFSKVFNETRFRLVAPTFSQAFRFFREKHNIVHSIDWMTRSGGEYPSGYIVHFRGINENILPIYNIMLNEDNIIVLNNTELPGYEVFPTYEEAELSCLKKLIEMVKNK